MSQKYDEYLEKHRQAVKKAYQWIAAYIPELTDVEATRNIEFHDMSKNTPDEYTPYAYPPKPPSLAVLGLNQRRT